MSEDRNDSSPAAEEKLPSALSGGADGGAADALDDAAAAPSWGEKWRLDLAGGDAELAKRFERFATPTDVGKAFIQHQNRIRSGRAVAPEPPEGATDLEMRDWRKQIGIPEAPDGYGISFPEGMKPSEKDQAELGQFLEFMHSRNVTSNAAKAAFEFYMTASQAGAAAAIEAAEEATRENIADLRNAFGGRREYTRNMTIAKKYLEHHFDGPDGDRELLNVLSLRTQDGVELGNYAPFVRAIVNMAREVASEADLIGGDGAGGGPSIDDEINQLAQKPRLTPAEHQRFEELAAARIRRDQRNGRA